MENRTSTAVKQVGSRDEIRTERRRLTKEFEHGAFTTIDELYHTTKASLIQHVKTQGLGFNSRFILNRIEGGNYAQYNDDYITALGLAGCFLSGTQYQNDIPDRSPYGTAMFTFPTSILDGYSFYFADTWSFTRNTGVNVYILIIAAKADKAAWLKYYLSSAEAFVRRQGTALQILMAAGLWTEILLVGEDDEVLLPGDDSYRAVGTFAGQSHTSRPQNCFREAIVIVPVPALVAPAPVAVVDSSDEESVGEEEVPEEEEEDVEEGSEENDEEEDEEAESAVDGEEESAPLETVFASKLSLSSDKKRSEK